jgi:hydroxysqualene dehydroxylase
MARTVHIIGAGLAGLSAAVKLASRGERVAVHEATAFAGGRCRSYHDAAIGMTIDNGNHLLLSGNRAALGYVRDIGAAHRLVGPPSAQFKFVDLASRESWTLHFNDGRLPLWIFAPSRRVPGTGALDYLPLARLLWPQPDKTVGEVIACKGPIYSRLIEPLLLAALNIDPPQGSAKLAAAVIRETLAAGGRACRPLIAREGLGATLIDPALSYLQQRGAVVQLGHELHAMRFGSNRVEALDFGGEVVALAKEDAVILAVPPYAATGLIQALDAPWIFAFPGRLSVTISAGDRLINTPREELARSIWNEVASVTALPSALPPSALPPWQIVRERRATFAATPAQDQKRPDAATPWSNLFLAGDWTNTGLPATIEGAIRSGNRAAELIGLPPQGDGNE